MSETLFTAAASFAQERLWFLEQLFPGEVAYTMAGAVRLSGALDVGALERALGAVAARHESLRTTFRAVEGTPRQVVAAQAEVRLRVQDLSGLAAAQRDKEALALASAEVRVPFDLAAGPLFRAVLYRTRADEHLLLLLMHHIVSDAWSVSVLLRELAEFYEASVTGRQPSLPELAIQYADYAEWQRDWLKGQELERQLEYWRGRLAGAPQVLELPTDHPRPPAESHRGAQHVFLIAREPSERIKALARREGVTTFMALLAAFEVLLFRYSGQSDLLVGTPIAGRNRTELEGLIGFFANTLVLRGELSGDPSVRELLGRVRETCLGAYAHQDTPFESLVGELRPERDLSRNPLFQAMLILENVPERSLDLPGLTVTPVQVDRRAAQLDLTLYLQETPEGLRGTFEYATDLFEAQTVARMAGHFQRLLEGLLEAPERRISALPLLTAEEASQQRAWNATATEYSSACVQELIARQAARTPERAAVEFAGRCLSYRDLEAKVERLARRLRARGVAPGARVGVFMERCPDMVVAVLAVLKAGGAYVPLDPAFPAERLAFMLEDSAAPLLLTHAAVAAEVPSRAVPILRVDEETDGEEVARSAAGPSPDDVAYVIYTSGSTGRPKGVAVTHRSLVNLLESMGREPGFGEADVMLSVTTLSFDIAALELYLPLMKGGKVVLASREEAMDGTLLVARLSSSGATVMQATPASWRLLLESGWRGTPGLKVLCGGEALPRDLADALLSRAGEVWNVYGPTETTVWSTACKLESGDGPISIGRPIANTQTWVLDAQLQRQPVGVPGELFIGGVGVARGYWQRPDLTAERFLPDPFSDEPGARLYRTGDLARWLPDGRLECLGRLDNQVKVRGFRIEPGEIETALRDCPGIDQAVVLAQDDGAGDRRLVAYLVPSGAASRDTASLRARLGSRLPQYMVPSSYVFLDALPLTPNGKVDRKALAKLEGEAGVPRADHAAPRTATQEIVASIWGETLGASAIGIHDNFFDVGGHSLGAARIIARLRSAFGVEVGLRSLFERPTIAGLAEAVDMLVLARRSALPGAAPGDREEYDL